ncbi:DUF6064 family protein [Bacteroides reticulotermitis]|uniref:Uncharacterized protein n=2 Tax=Bacteroides reticulotermitis TaxID=1133319 RepID=W4UR64_9BACE|nr:DUF6064 family protein [Bacteroides reticulotermitis]MBB4043776.1 hypothetical protein [Bacteroides reticulotermitis]GAE83297.1 hypothetical protein JCM10512_1560 [Bacteroides reticulotermitis JCM 10512]
MEIFWKTIAYYNSATWILQVVIVLIGIVLTAMLVHKPSEWSKRLMKGYMIVLYTWIAVVYYYIYCAERSYNGVMALFWGVMAVIWVWDLITDYTTFERTYKYDFLSYILLAMPFVYPLVSLARGLTFPGMTSPVMPCSVVVFTIGLLLLFARRVNMFLVLFLCHWSLIGLSKTYFFQIPEDFLLASAAIPGLYLFFREYFLSNLHADTKPKAKYINWLLIAVCIGLAILLTTTLFLELMPKG